MNKFTIYIYIYNSFPETISGVNLNIKMNELTPYTYTYNPFPETISGVNLTIKMNEFTLNIHIYNSFPKNHIWSKFDHKWEGIYSIYIYYEQLS